MHLWIWGGIATLIIVAISILLAARIVISCVYTHQHKEDWFELTVHVFGIKLYEIKSPLMEVNLSTQTFSFKEVEEGMGNKKEKEKKWSLLTMKHFIKKSQEWINHFPYYKRLVDRFLRNVTVSSLTWRTELGTGDAASTAQLTGTVWGVKTLLLGWASYKVNWQAKHELSVQPHFQAAGLAVSFSCIASFRIGHAIRTGLSLAFSYRSRKKKSSHTSNAHAL